MNADEKQSTFRFGICSSAFISGHFSGLAWRRDLQLAGDVFRFAEII
jgi:hypothetical protein